MVQLDQFPMFRLTALLMRQMSSPIASKIKVYARQHPRFSRVVCARAANLYCSVELRARLLAARAAGTRAPPHPACAPLTEAQALDLGSSILGEGVLFVLLSAILIFEMNRQAMKQEAKEAAKEEEWEQLLVVLETIRGELQRQQLHLDALRRLLRDVTEPGRAEPGSAAGQDDRDTRAAAEPPASEMKSSKEPALRKFSAGASTPRRPHEGTALPIPARRREQPSEC